MNETNHPAPVTCTLIQDLLNVKDGGIYEAVVKLKQRLDAAVAECAAFKSAHPQPFGPLMMQALDAYEKHQDDVPETGMLNAFFILRDSIAVEAPNVTAALAEVEAKAIEKFVTKSAERLRMAGGEDGYSLVNWGEYADHLEDKGEEFAAELREGRV